MIFNQLDFHDFRVFKSSRLTPNPRFNVFYGPNGSGKTSFLEALSLLCTAKSFRTHDLASLVSFNKTLFTLYGRTDSDEQISIQKSQDSLTVRLNQRSCSRRSELAKRVPCQVFYQTMFGIIDAGPQVRRRLLDWGLFHVKHHYHDVWRNYQRVLKQRNALLKQKAGAAMVVPWDKQLTELAETLDEFRAAYCVEWFQAFEAVLRELTDLKCELEYEKGWDKKKQGKRLPLILNEQFEADKMRQYTQSGAHQADISLRQHDRWVKKSLSRGQQKVILIALKLAQAQLIKQPCVYLMDDVFSELDEQHRQRLLKYLERVPGQFYIATLDESLIKNSWQHSDCSFHCMDELGRVSDA